MAAYFTKDLAEQLVKQFGGIRPAARACGVSHKTLQRALNPDKRARDNTSRYKPKWTPEYRAWRKSLSPHQKRKWRLMHEPGYRDKYREGKRKAKHTRRERMRGGDVTKAGRAALFEVYGGRCAYCGVVGDLHIDHVVPLGRGGAHTLENIVPCCQDCNQAKGTRTAAEWFAGALKPTFRPDFNRALLELIPNVPPDAKDR